jgi:pimeloyl-ACP methyl ester carboxylesterase
VEPLVLVPGLVCDGDLYAEQLAGLADLTEVVVSDVSRGASIGEMAQAALDVAPEQFALAGMSLGGYVVWEVLRRAPQRVTRLALLDTSARPETPAQTARRRELIALGDADGFPAVLDALWPAEVAAGRVDDVGLRRRFDAMCQRHGPDVFRRQQEAIVVRADSRPDLAGVRVPTLVLCGRDDAITPLDGHEEMAAGIPGAELVVLDDCGHLSTWERPEQVTAALRGWLAH